MNAAHFPGSNDWSFEGANCNSETGTAPNGTRWPGAQVKIGQEQWNGGGMGHQHEPSLLGAGHIERMAMQQDAPDDSQAAAPQAGCSFAMGPDFNAQYGVQGFSLEWDRYLRSVFAIVQRKAQEQQRGLKPDLRPLRSGSSDAGLSNGVLARRGLPGKQSKLAHLARNMTTAKLDRSSLASQSPSGGMKRSFPDDDGTGRSHEGHDDNNAGEDDSEADGSQEDEAESEPEHRPIDPSDHNKLREYYEECLRHIQQTQCRRVGQDWIKAVHPKKQAKYPYSQSKAKGCSTKPPPWWPDGVDHVEPAHIKADPRIKLLLHIVCNTRRLKGTGHTNEFGVEESVTVKWLKKATDANPKIVEDKRAQVWLNHIYAARSRAEEAEDGGREGATLMVPWPPKRRSRRGNNTQRRKTEDTRANDDDANGVTRFWGHKSGSNGADDDYDTIRGGRKMSGAGDGDDSSSEGEWNDSGQEDDLAVSHSFTDTTSTSTSPSIRAERSAAADFLGRSKGNQGGMSGDRTHPDLHVNTRLRLHQNNPSGLRNEESVKMEREEWNQRLMNGPGIAPGSQAHSATITSPMHNFHASQGDITPNAAASTAVAHLQMDSWLQQNMQNQGNTMQNQGNTLRAPQRQGSLQVGNSAQSMEQTNPDMIASFSQASNLTHTPALGGQYNENQLAQHAWPQSLDSSMFGLPQQSIPTTQAGHWPKVTPALNMVSQPFPTNPQIAPTNFMGHGHGQTSPMSPNTTEMNHNFQSFGFATPGVMPPQQQQQHQQKQLHGPQIPMQHPSHHQVMQHVQQQQQQPQHPQQPQMMYNMNGGHPTGRPHPQPGF